MISFKAKYINSVAISRIQPETKYKKPITAAFTEVSPFCTNDIETIQDVTYGWGGNETFASNINSNLRDCNWCQCHNGKRFFALTTQPDEYKKLRPEDILGLAEVIEGNSDYIKLNYLQVDPYNKHQSPYRIFSGIGTAIIDSIQKFFNKDINLRSVPSAVKFYKKYGFEQIRNTREFILKR